jgi:beta-phosphoglucomutase family hydrolase
MGREELNHGRRWRLRVPRGWSHGRGSRHEVAGLTGTIRQPYEAVIFDMDGVVTDTASVHAAAWKRLFDGFLASRDVASGAPIVPFDADADYRRYVDGRSREDGVATFLAARGIELPPGGPADPPSSESVAALARRKNRLFEEAIAGEGVRAFPSTVALLTRLRRGGVLTAVVSASRNASAVLAAAGVDGLFDVRVDGDEAARLGLPGKPDPALFLEAARRLGVAPARAAVVEDAAAGVEAARRGGFGLIVGVNRTGHRADLVDAGASVVVGDLGELDLGATLASPWLVAYEGFDPAHEAQREAICTLGNGYLGTRGASSEATDDGVHYPGTYLAGLYNRLGTRLGGRSVDHEHLVNVPNWLPLDIRVGEGGWLSASAEQVVGERRELDLRSGVLTRTLRLTDPDERRTTLTQRRLVSMARPHVAAMETTVIAENWSGVLHVRASLDGRVVNENVAEDRLLAHRHLVPAAATEAGPDTIVLEVDTSQSHVRIAEAARVRVAGAAGPPVTDRVETSAGWVARELELRVRQGEPVIIDKVVAIATSRDPAAGSPRAAALSELARAGGFDSLLPPHEQAWGRLWDRFGISADADVETSLALNLHVFHLLQSLSPHTVGLDVGVPVRGLHGEGYRGHVFWDELFVFPLLNLRLPSLTRSLLVYRWRRLDAARDAARRAGLPGALFPWQSGSDGREETPDQLFNARSLRWMPDNSHLQRHIGLAVAYNVWQYYQVTADADFMTAQGTEMLAEVARLFAGLAEHDAADDRYDIAGVVGPDEYHDRYPGAERPGLRNNAYTNVLTAWALWRAMEALEVSDAHHGTDLWERLELTREEVSEWDRISRRLRVPFHADGIISQFEGYEELAEFDWERYRTAYGNIGRLDLILEAEGDTTNRYKLSKQADVLMLFYLFSSDELAELFGRLGYPLDREAIPRTVDYYLARAAHGSTLSRLVHSWVLARTDRERSWWVFRDALDADLDDTQGGTTGEGIHLGAMAGTIDLVLRGYAGIQVRDDTLWFDPRLPPELRGVRFDVFYRGQRVSVDVAADRLRLRLHPSAAAAIAVGVNGTVMPMAAGETREFPLER